MTEAEWLVCTDPLRMFDVLRGNVRRPDGSVTAQRTPGIPEQRLTYRKLRLFACAACRAVWHLLADVRSRHAVEVAERFADGATTEEELRQADRQATEGWSDLWGSAAGAATQLAWYTTGADPIRAAYEAVGKGRALEGPVAASLLREVFGNPFNPRPPRQRKVAKCWNEDLAFWLAWQGDTPVQMAQAIYENGSFGDLPILADVLEEAGCIDNVILNHLRAPEPHVRGCWVVDALLRKA